MNPRKIVSFFTFVLLGVGLVVVPAPAHAAPAVWNYLGYTGGTLVRGLDSTVQSDLTAQSAVFGTGRAQSSKNSTAAVKVGDLATVGAVETTTSADVNFLSGTTLRASARTAGVRLLDGLVTADAVETLITTTGRNDGTTTSTGSSKLVDLKIAGINLPVEIPKNYSVTIPGIATVTMNFSLHGKVEDVSGTIGWALGIHLLKPRGDAPAGAVVLLNPVNQYLSETGTEGAALAGSAYGTRVSADAGDQVSVVSDPTAQIATPRSSSGGRTLTNTKLGVNVPGLLSTGLVTSTSTSTKDGFGNAEITNVNQTAGLNVLGGLIKADAIKATATNRFLNGEWTHLEEVKLVNLVVAGQQIPVNVSPNTTIDVANLGQVTINLQTSSDQGIYQNQVMGLRVVLSTERAGLPVGAVIEVAVARTFIAPLRG